MGVPIECEHGDDSSSNTLQTTTTGIALYFWCTNTPSFTRGQEHWMLTRDGETAQTASWVRVCKCNFALGFALLLRAFA